MPADYDPAFDDESAATFGWDEGKDLPENFWGEELPKPLFWRILVMPVRPREVSKGGIVLTRTSQEDQKHLNYIGKIVALGALAGTDKRLLGEYNFPKVGDYVVYARYSGQVMLYRGVRLLIINDDEILATAKNPEALKINL